MAELIEEGKAQFDSDSQILSELGERLISSKRIALAELIKNAYDADATKCNIWLEEDSLIVKDNGHGMTEDEFLDFWMTVATPNRNQEPESRRYNRKVTGSKGVGRFAVRHLGKALELETVAYDEGKNEYLKLTAEFDWSHVEMGEDLGEVVIPYRLEKGFEEEDEGTKLKISSLQDSWDQEKLGSVSDEVMNVITSPFETEVDPDSDIDQDPGFNVRFAPPGKGSPHESAAREIYERAVAKVYISVENAKVKFEYEFDDSETREYVIDLEENLVGEIEGEIRYLPRRSGIFRGMEEWDGREARGWMTDNGGVRIIDKGFRVPPYGGEGNDWLRLAESNAKKKRRWLSDITKEIFPSDDVPNEHTRDPHLNIPTNYQLLGSVHVDTNHPAPEDPSDELRDALQPAMDRQGLIENEAFEQLEDIVRGSLEILAVIDKEKEVKKKKEKAEKERNKVKEDIESAIEEVQGEDDLDPETKEDLIESYRNTQERIENYKDQRKEAEKAVESMQLLSTVSAVMSHETDELKRSGNRLRDELEAVPEDYRDDEFNQTLREAKDALEGIERHQHYTRMFTERVTEDDQQAFKVYHQVEMVIDQFENYTDERDIKVTNGVSKDLESPETNVALYNGVLLNLFSNAAKAVVQVSNSERDSKVKFTAHNDENYHYLRVLDNGIGIPEELEDRIFDPLFTTSDVEGPFGSGTGLGLYLVEKALGNMGGDISVKEAPEGFETCFEVKLEK